jgi:hypothetical protein
VAARFRGASPGGDVSGKPLGLPTFFPGTANMGQAQRIPLATGEERSGVSFSPLSPRATRIWGTVIDSTGAAAGGAKVELLDATDMTAVAYPFGNFGETFRGGEFTIIDVVPGSYVLAARVSRPGGGVETTFLPLQVNGSEIAGITLTTTSGVTINGTVSAAPGLTLPPLRATITARSLRGSNVQSEMLDRGTAFTLSGLSGPYSLTVEELPNGWTLQSFELNGTDVADGGYDFPPSGRLSARVVLTNRLTEVSGVVSSARAGVPDADVVIFPDEPKQWVYPSRMVRAVRTNAAGHFRLVGLPPASRYFAIALDFVDADEYQDPELLERLRPRATPFSLGDGGKVAVDLVMVPR